jgi:hypothetical protein
MSTLTITMLTLVALLNVAYIFAKVTDHGWAGSAPTLKQKISHWGHSEQKPY